MKVGLRTTGPFTIYAEINPTAGGNPDPGFIWGGGGGFRVVGVQELRANLACRPQSSVHLQSNGGLGFRV